MPLIIDNQVHRWGASERTWFPSSALVAISADDFGAVPDATSGSVGTDSTAALNSAFSQTGAIVKLSKGGYRFTSNLNVPTCAAIIGAGKDDTILYPSAAVSAALTTRTPVAQIT